MKVVFSNNRVIDSLRKYDNHTITSISNCGEYIRVELEFNSPSKKSKTNTIVKIYCDNYFDLEKSNKEQEDEHPKYL